MKRIFTFFIHGSQQYKVGIHPESIQGVIGYFSKAKDGQYSLVFMEFPVMPEAGYVDRPKVEQQSNGDTIQIYSHLEKGQLAFGELECHSWGLDLEAGKEGAFPIKIYIYKGTLEAMNRVGKKLICSQFDQAYIF